MDVFVLWGGYADCDHGTLEGVFGTLETAKQNAGSLAIWESTDAGHWVAVYDGFPGDWNTITKALMEGADDCLAKETVVLLVWTPMGGVVAG